MREELQQPSGLNSATNQIKRMRKWERMHRTLQMQCGGSERAACLFEAALVQAGVGVYQLGAPCSACLHPGSCRKRLYLLF